MGLASIRCVHLKRVISASEGGLYFQGVPDWIFAVNCMKFSPNRGEIPVSSVEAAPDTYAQSVERLFVCALSLLLFLYERK